MSDLSPLCASDIPSGGGADEQGLLHLLARGGRTLPTSGYGRQTSKENSTPLVSGPGIIGRVVGKVQAAASQPPSFGVGKYNR